MPKDYWRTSKHVTGVGPEDRGLKRAFEKNITVKCPARVYKEGDRWAIWGNYKGRYD